MALPTIPAGICVAAQGYGYGGPTGARRTEVAGGRGRYGLNYYGGTSQFAVTLVIPPEVHRIWTLFYHRRIALGTLPFLLDIDSGMGIEPHEVNIVPDTYSVTVNQTVWIVTFTVEARASAYNVPQDVLDLEFEYWDNTGQPLDKMLDRLTIFANEDVLILNEVTE